MISKVACVLSSCCYICKRCDGSAWHAVSPNRNTPAPCAPSPPAMVKTFQAYLPQCHRTYSCIHCRAHLANHDELISKSFQGSQGRAYLFNSVVNVGCGPAEERVLLTGLHAVADIYCECCKTTLGWKYEHAFESSQKYKEGKFIIELAHMIKENGWD
ncbi:yippee-like isoform X2 [Rhynchophorus ferrugineus]|uniref:yippee-like isoform X2 n=1 Tax=Rhynchophorus ferrugineus TaxID=354439 RepID=UPI003FCD2C6D